MNKRAILRGIVAGFVCFIVLSFYFGQSILISLYYGSIDFGFWIPVYSSYLLASVFTGFSFYRKSNKLIIASIIVSIVIFLLSVFYVVFLPILILLNTGY
jgi:hypothetical protein